MRQGVRFPRNYLTCVFLKTEVAKILTETKIFLETMLALAVQKILACNKFYAGHYILNTPL